MIASPIAAESEWVSRELKWWLENRKYSDIFIAVANGTISWSNTSQSFSADTNCLSQILISNFQQEPHWLDLRSFNSSKEKLSYRNEAFKMAAIKLIAAIIGKSPHEIDSEDRRIVKRNRNIGVGVVFILLTLVFASVFFWFEDRITKRVSLSNKFMAEANRVRINNPTQALVLFVEGYAINPDTSNFLILNEFYKAHSIMVNQENKLIDTMSVFAKTVLAPGLFVKDEEDNLQMIISQKHKLAILFLQDSVVRIDLSKNTIDTLLLKNGEFASFTYDKESEKIYLLHHETGPEVELSVLMYDIETGSIDTVVSSNNQSLVFMEKSIPYSFSSYCPKMLRLSDNGIHLVLTDTKTKVFCLPLDSVYLSDERFYKSALGFNLRTGEVRRIIFRIGGEYVDQIQPSNDGQYLYSFWSGAGSSTTYFHQVSSTVDSLEERVFFEGDNHSADVLQSPTCFKWFDDSKGFMYGLANGTVIIDFFGHYKNGNLISPVISLSGNLIGDAISCLVNNAKYIIGGTAKGKILIWKNYYPEIGAMTIVRHGYPLVREIQLPTNNAIIQIRVDDNGRQLLVEDNLGGVYQVNLKNYIRLSQEVDVLRKQLKMLDIDTIQTDIMSSNK